MHNIAGIFKFFAVSVIKVLYILPFVLFGLWLVQTVYFPNFEPSDYIGSAKPVKNDGTLRTIPANISSAPSEHFHMIDEYVTRKDTDPPLCLMCHKVYPHSKEKKFRSILNFHAGLIACSVCHSRKNIDDKAMVFTWVDRDTGFPIAKIEGAYGKYEGRIFPAKYNSDRSKTIYRPIDEKVIEEFDLLREKSTPEQLEQARLKLHKNISPQPVLCSDCHKKEGYLDFSSLGFSDQRITHLNSNEVVGMVEKYNTFFLPSVMRLGKGDGTEE